MPSSISERIDGIDKLDGVLCGFDPAAVLEKYDGEWENLLRAVDEEFPQVRSMRHGPRSHWPKYCQSVISCAKFLSRFADASDFQKWADFFDRDERARLALPLLLAQEVYGFRFALACDFFKELGYEGFCKPDVHVKKIFAALGLAVDASDLSVFKAVGRVASKVGKTPYYVDKLFWLIGSGKFYKNDISVGQNRERFIEATKARLASA